MLRPGAPGLLGTRARWKGGEMGKARFPVLCASLATLVGCNLAGPVLDPSMRHAHVRSCGDVPADWSAAQPIENGCFTFERRQAADATEIVAFLRATPECSNSFSRATLTVSADGPGAVSLTVFGGAGALPDHRWRWNGPIEGRIFHSSGLNGPFVVPIGATIRVPVGGAARPTRLCFTRY
jgi:hypothetical protein